MARHVVKTRVRCRNPECAAGGATATLGWRRAPSALWWRGALIFVPGILILAAVTWIEDSLLRVPRFAYYLSVYLMYCPVFVSIYRPSRGSLRVYRLACGKCGCSWKWAEDQTPPEPVDYVYLPALHDAAFYAVQSRPGPRGVGHAALRCRAPECGRVGVRYRVRSTRPVRDTVALMTMCICLGAVAVAIVGSASGWQDPANRGGRHALGHGGGVRTAVGPPTPHYRHATCRRAGILVHLPRLWPPVGLARRRAHSAACYVRFAGAGPYWRPLEGRDILLRQAA